MKKYRFNENGECLNPDRFSMRGYRRQYNRIDLYLKEGLWYASFSFSGSTRGISGKLETGKDTKEQAVIECLIRLDRFMSCEENGETDKTKLFYDAVEERFLQTRLF
jgi:hypothetical protein